MYIVFASLETQAEARTMREAQRAARIMLANGAPRVVLYKYLAGEWLPYRVLNKEE